MNTPNKLTLLRICLVPFFMAFMLLDQIPYNYLIALAIFVAASLTDLLDGRLARKYGLVTDFGKFMDPLADKLLVTAALILLQDLQLIPSVVVFIIIAREFIVTALRLVAAPKGVVIAADRWGKYKTVSQMVWIIYGLLILWLVNNTGWLLGETTVQRMLLGNELLLVVVTALTVFSGCNYLWANKNLIADVK